MLYQIQPLIVDFIIYGQKSICSLSSATFWFYIFLVSVHLKGGHRSIQVSTRWHVKVRVFGSSSRHPRKPRPWKPGQLSTTKSGQSAVAENECRPAVSAIRAKQRNMIDKKEKFISDGYSGIFFFYCFFYQRLFIDQ